MKKSNPNNGTLKSSQYEDLLSVICEIQKSSIDPLLWPKSAESIRKLIGGHTVNLGIVNQFDSRLDYIYSSTFSREDLDFYDSEIIHLDEILGLYDRVDPGDVILTQNELSTREQRDLECYQRFYEPSDHRHFNAGLIQRNTASLGWISVVRGKNDQHFTKSEFNLMKLIIPHLQNAFIISQLIYDKQKYKSISISFFDKLNYGILFFDQRGRIIGHNSKVDKLLTEGKIKLKNQNLILPKNRTALLNKQLKITTSASSIKNKSSTIHFSDNSGCRFLLFITPSTTNESQNLWLKSQAVTIGTLIDFSSTPEMSASTIMEAFQITLRESMLCQKLLSGLTISESAKELGITQGTARFYLKNIFQKTGVRRQSELILLLMNLHMSGNVPML